MLFLRASPSLLLLFSLGLVPEILLLDEALEQRKRCFSSVTERRSLLQPNLRQKCQDFIPKEELTVPKMLGFLGRRGGDGRGGKFSQKLEQNK